MDIRAQQAHENHRLAAEAEAKARLHRRQRDHLVRLLRAEDPERWSLRNLARAVGCSRELIAGILRAAKPPSV